MEIRPVAYIHTDFPTKFGLPRQSGLVEGLKGEIVFEPYYRNPEGVKGLDGFSHLWLLWDFSLAHREDWSATAKPPRLGGRTHMGVWATRSPFRPNSIGLSSVRLDRIEMTADRGPVLHVSGIDMMDGTPIYDIKPYVAYADSHPEAKCGFVDQTTWKILKVEIPEPLAKLFCAEDIEMLRQTLALDPRPSYHDDPQRIYGMPFGDYDVRFRVEDDTLAVVGCNRL